MRAGNVAPATRARFGRRARVEGAKEGGHPRSYEPQEPTGNTSLGWGRGRRLPRSMCSRTHTLPRAQAAAHSEERRLIALVVLVVLAVAALAITRVRRHRGGAAAARRTRASLASPYLALMPLRQAWRRGGHSRGRRVFAYGYELEQEIAARRLYVPPSGSVGVCARSCMSKHMYV